MRYFLFLYIENEELSALANLAVYLLNPNEKWPAHITLAGPYNSKRKIPSDLDYDRKVSSLGVSEFRSSKQNTVFLRMGTEDLRSVWDKPDFPYNPHMTLYDGEDVNLANLLYKKLDEARMFFKFFVSRIFVVSSPPKQGSFDLLAQVDPRVMIETAYMSVDDLKSLSVSQRVELAVAAMKRVKVVSSRS